MRRHDDPTVVCPFDAKHKMPSARLQWHLPKCKAYKEHLAEGRPVLHCPHNYYHIFFGEAELEAHLGECQNRRREQEAREQEQELDRARKQWHTQRLEHNASDLFSTSETDNAVGSEGISHNAQGELSFCQEVDQ